MKAITGGKNTTSMTNATPRNDTNTQPDKPRDREPKDPNSDVTPPTLGTIEFSPALVHDGEAIGHILDDAEGVGDPVNDARLVRRGEYQGVPR